MGDLQKRRLPGAIDRTHADIEAAFARHRNDLQTQAYAPGNADDWATPAPTTVTEALDRLAAKIAEYDGGTSPGGGGKA